MKITKLYVASAKFFWDCWECGNLNVVDYHYAEGVKGKKNLSCNRCSSQRKAVIDFDLGYPSENLTRYRKLKKVQKKWGDKQVKKKQDYIKSLRQELKQIKKRKRTKTPK